MRSQSVFWHRRGNCRIEFGNALQEPNKSIDWKEKRNQAETFRVAIIRKAPSKSNYAELFLELGQNAAGSSNDAKL